MQIKDLIAALQKLPGNLDVTFHVQTKFIRPGISSGMVFPKPTQPCWGLTDKLRALRVGQTKLMQSQHESGIRHIAKRIGIEISYRTTSKGYLVTRMR